jgi:Fe-S cluster assembly protein SufD
MIATSQLVPTRKDEAWRYAPPPVLAALTELPAPEPLAVAPGGKAAIHGSFAAGIHRYAVTIGENARAEAFFVLAGSGYKRLELDVTLAEGAHFELGGVIAAGSDEVAECVTRIRHVAPGATSHQLVRAVASGSGTINVLGRIDVARPAQQTDAALGIKGLLQGRQATINAKPELEIFADDVKCAHGCAIGQMDEAALFYAQARGLPLDQARVLLMQAFAAEAFLALADDTARDSLESAATAAIGGGA